MKIQIHETQLQALASAQISNFCARLAVHLSECFPKKFGALSKDEKDQSVQAILDSAHTHNLETERDICLYAEAEVLLGHDFTLNPETSFLADILAKPLDRFAGFDPLVELNNQAWSFAQKNGKENMPYE